MGSLRIRSIWSVVVIACAAFTCQIMANPITCQQAKINAQTFLQQRSRNIGASSLCQVPMDLPTATYYVFNVGNNGGYVIAAGDDCVPAILGYADEGCVNIDNIPCNMQSWLDEYARQIQLMQEKGLSASRVPGKSPLMPAISPLLTSQWNQTYPYNMYCPRDTNGRRCLTGCVATAMAQVLYYHRNRSVSQTTREMTSYVTERGVSVDAVPAGSMIDWENMVDSYKANIPTTDEQKAAVANLMKYCGTAVQMDYTSSSSGAFSPCAAHAMVAYFNYSSKTKYLDRGDSGMSDDEWENLVYDELSNSRPVFYSGWAENNTGHAFVCDGYDGEGYFHINWGWGGSQGYYLLTVIDSAASSLLDYHLYQDAVIHAEPRQDSPSQEDGIQFADPIAEAVCLQSADVNDDGVLTMEEASAVTSMASLIGACMSSFDEFWYFTGVTSLCLEMFFECSRMKSIVLHNALTSIGERAFRNCSSLTEITVPCSVTSIGNMAFAGCSSLKRLTWNAKRCTPSVAPVVNGAVEYLTIGDSVEVIPNNFAKNARLKGMTIGKSVNIIGASAFYNCTGLKRVVLPNSVVTINQKAFYENMTMEELVLSENLTLINDNAFFGCSRLKQVTIPNSVTKIGMYAFNGCAGLSSLTIGNSVATISSNAFSGCSSLKTVTCLVKEPIAIKPNVFNNLYGQAVLRVPADAVDAYKATSPWDQFSEILAIDPADGDVNLDGVTNIDDVTHLIDQILKNTFTEYSDVNTDSNVNIDDVTALISILLSDE